ncbi:angiogenin-2-like [Pelodiscus sinensis]|uniref:angiogenin-2-like n=1 Tax=Pelodiscus sinensis TaxID=13735 RepID=UPI003F6D3603
MALRVAPLLLTAALLAGASASEEQYKRFLLQHYDPRPSGHNDRYCTDRMRRMLQADWKQNPRPGGKVCKDTNTFIHANSDAIRAVCTPQGGKDHVTQGQRMRQSLRQFQVTTCKFKGGKPLDRCQYRATHSTRTIVIRCDGENRPVHFHENWI